LRTQDLVTIQVESVKQAGTAANIDDLIYDQWRRDEMTVAGKGPQYLLAVEIDAAESSIRQVDSKITGKCGRRIRIEAESKICAGAGVECDPIGWKTRRVANIYSSIMKDSSRTASSCTWSPVAPLLLARTY
jgi:hypothetical protein